MKLELWFVKWSAFSGATAKLYQCIVDGKPVKGGRWRFAWLKPHAAEVSQRDFGDGPAAREEMRAAIRGLTNGPGPE